MTFRAVIWANGPNYTCAYTFKEDPYLEPLNLIR